jgi:predicted dehydrogenase
MRILFIGLGSIGKRHLENVITYLNSIYSTYVIDAVRSGKGNPLDSSLSELINTTYSYDDSIEATYDVAFITNPTALHFETLKGYGHVAKAYFIEKPVFDQVDYPISELNLPADAIFYVACPLRYTEILQYVKNNVDLKDAYCVRSICSSYLPDWRKGIDYRTTYSAQKALGGGVSIDLIHEWDYLSWLFGPPDQIKSIIAKVSDLEIDSDDLALYIARNENTVFELHLDYFGRETIRKMEIFFPDRTLTVDLSNNILDFGKARLPKYFEEERNTYQIREIQHFFRIVHGEIENDNPIEKALQTVQLAKGRV